METGLHLAEHDHAQPHPPFDTENRSNPSEQSRGLFLAELVSGINAKYLITLDNLKFLQKERFLSYFQE